MLVKELLEQVRVGESTVLDLAKLEDGTRKITVEMRRLQGEEPRPPVRAESPRRSHVFHTAEALGDYLARYGSEKSVVFVDVSKGCMTAVIDETSATGFETISMAPAMHPLFAPWHKVIGSNLAVQDFAAFAQANRRAIFEPSGRDLAIIFSQISAAVTVEINKGRGKDAVNGIVVKSKINGAEVAGIVEIPETVKARVPLFVGTDPAEIEVDLNVEADRGGCVVVSVSAGTLLDVRVKVFQKMCEAITAKLPRATIVFGSPNIGNWEYLKEIDAGQRAVCRHCGGLS